MMDQRAPAGLLSAASNTACSPRPEPPGSQEFDLGL